jgi:tRNA threonylcarbamoyladenosine biosynthesis protein TsaB
MTLYIDTTNNDKIIIALKKQGRVIIKKELVAERAQAEKLLPAIDKLLKNNQLDLKTIKKMEVANSGGTFTALRIGVVTANTLAYALGIPVCGTSGQGATVRTRNNRFTIVKPIYSRAPNITKKKKV